MRGFACLLMFEVHGYDSWLTYPLQETKFYQFSQFTGTIAAPIFLFLAGASLALVSDRMKQKHESARPLPAPGSPNVLLIMLDTVAASHLNLHGYRRATCTTLVELAERGVRFDSARAASSWTLPSHASMFT